MAPQPSQQPTGGQPGVAQQPNGQSNTDCPILVWILTLNREYTKEEYKACYEVVKQCIPHVKLPYDYKNPDSFRQLITHMLPLLMMRHRRIPRAKWRDIATTNGKRWIEQIAEDMPPERFLSSKIGYHLCIENSLCAMAMTQGPERKVVNIGLAMRHQAVEPKSASVLSFRDSMSHKLTPREYDALADTAGSDSDILRRLCIIIALKQAYLSAIGQPIGFDMRRLDFDIPNNKAWGDGEPLQGWEFRIFKVEIGVARGAHLVEETYQCVSAFFRGTIESTFIWDNQQATLESWVQFINIDQMIKVMPKLLA